MRTRSLVLSAAIALFPAMPATTFEYTDTFFGLGAEVSWVPFPGMPLLESVDSAMAVATYGPTSLPGFRARGGIGYRAPAAGLLVGTEWVIWERLSLARARLFGFSAMVDAVLLLGEDIALTGEFSLALFIPLASPGALCVSVGITTEGYLFTRICLTVGAFTIVSPS